PARAQAPSTPSPGNSVTFAAGWNLVAFPQNTDLSKVTSSLFTMQPGDTDYETVDPTQGTQTGFGYWAYFASSTAVTLDAGGSFYATIAPAGSYIMVGNPSGITAAVVSGADLVYTYDPVAGYNQSPLLNPGQGAWVLSNNGGPITVSATQASTGPPPGAQPPSGRFYGAVTAQGAPAAAGTTVTAAAASGAACGSTTVGAAPASGSNYALDLTGSDPGCSTAGSALTFSVGGAVAAVVGTSTVPDVSGAVKADLAAP
ncbi:MAG TPA: hypothetical protein VK821_01360, partial [Dehalococcoidia bacterium]|nr:hypothetical protein [Dehalococcoidia bacterium]